MDKGMDENEFLYQFHSLLRSDVSELDLGQKINLIRALCVEVEQAKARQLPAFQVVPFITGRRPIDEAAHPGLGSSDCTGMILEDGRSANNQSYILYYINGLEPYLADSSEAVSIDVTLSFTGTDGSQPGAPISGWDRRLIEPLVFAPSESGLPNLQAIPIHEASGKNLVLSLSPNLDFLPGNGWDWDDLDERVRQGATDAADPFTFGHMFSQIVKVTLRLICHGVPLAMAQTDIDICDQRRFGSLYQRIIECVIKPDTEQQVRAAGRQNVDYAYHPWFPVLLIGSEKANLYTDALIEDIVYKKRHLTDPRWLMRVGLYLELLTCIGVFEAVKGELGDLLTPAERAAYEKSTFFAEIRKRVNIPGWRKVFALRDIIFPRFGTPQTGPVSIINLLQKKKATLEFLEVHHDDLKHAIELAGHNEYNAQETWHRVFRDAERAVLSKTADAFPELSFLDANVKDFILWHRKGKIELRGMRWVPDYLSSFFGDQDGLFASACNQYRASMNEVAEWAKHRHLMDYTGEECVAERVCLLHAYMSGQEAQLARLQGRDGYRNQLNVNAKLPQEYAASVEDVYAMLAEVPIFRMLTEEEMRHLAHTARQIMLGPMERIIIEGREGSSLFLVAEGQLEVFVRQPDGTDRLVDVKNPGDVIGEISLLTGVPRTATVRALDGAMVYEIGKKQYEPIIKERPAIINELAVIMERNLQNIREHRDTYKVESKTGLEKESSALGHRIRMFFFGGTET